MNFELTDEMLALQDSLGRLLRDLHTPRHRQAVAAGAVGYSEEIWKQLAELGVTALLVPEQNGGIGGSPADLLPVMQEFGRALVSVPFLSSSVLGATALLTAADEGAARALLPGVAAGDILLAWAHDELARDHEADSVSTAASRTQHGWRLDGTKNDVLYASSADHFIVSARTGERHGGCALFLVPGKTPGLRLRTYRLIDGTPAGELLLEDVAAAPLCDIEAADEPATQAVLGVGMAAVCAEMVGCMEAAFRLSVDYLNTRQQFGRFIGSNQALRHRVADMLVSLEMARSMAIAALVAAAGTGMREQATRAELHRAKFLVGRNARSVCQTAIQLHGGIGMTEEYAVGHYLRRVHVLDHLFGDSTVHGEWLASAAGDVG